MNVRGKAVLLTGASSGIGLAAARLLAAQGARLALVARSEDKLGRLPKSFRTRSLCRPISPISTLPGEWPPKPFTSSAT